MRVRRRKSCGAKKAKSRDRADGKGKETVGSTRRAMGK